jgi:exopolyphosphatase / guanosine-5'-triphosphate,3'-diphosphate pyrophosphatase
VIETFAGLGARIDQASSVAVGCVSYLDYFPGGAITREALDSAQSAARDQFNAVAEQFSGLWTTPIGCSGTLLAVDEVLKHRTAEKSNIGISQSALQELRAALQTFDNVASVSFEGLSESRRSVFASGLAIVLALFDSFAIDSMQLSDVGLREGLAWQLLHREQ